MPEVHPFPDEFSPVGSSVFYAIRFAPPGRRSALSMVNAFYRTVRNIPVTCSDPGVANEKLNWWRQEMQRSLNSQAQHPIAKSMGALQRQHGLQGDYLESFFQAVGQEIGTFAIENDIDLENHCRHSGALLADMNALIGGANEAQRQSARELGSFIRMVEIIRDIGVDLRRNRCFIPIDRLHHYQLYPAQLLTVDVGKKLMNLLSSITELQQQSYQKTLDEITDQTGLGPVLGMAAMSERLLQTIHTAGYRRILQQRTSLTPLHKLWISWQCQRRIR